MRYITHTQYEGTTMAGKDILIHRGRPLSRDGDVLYYRGMPICIYRSYSGKQHFAIDEDGEGMKRGMLTHEIAYSPRVCTTGTRERPSQHRFSEEEAEILRTRWGKYLRHDCDMLLFNDQFFEAPIEELVKVAISVNMDPYLCRKEKELYHIDSI